MHKPFVHTVKITWSTQLCSDILNSCLLAIETGTKAALEIEGLLYALRQAFDKLFRCFYGCVEGIVHLLYFIS